MKRTLTHRLNSPHSPSYRSARKANTAMKRMPIAMQKECVSFAKWTFCCTNFHVGKGDQLIQRWKWCAVNATRRPARFVNCVVYTFKVCTTCTDSMANRSYSRTITNAHFVLPRMSSDNYLSILFGSPTTAEYTLFTCNTQSRLRAAKPCELHNFVMSCCLYAHKVITHNMPVQHMHLCGSFSIC